MIDAKRKYIQNGEDKKNSKGLWVTSYPSREKGTSYWTRSWCVWNGLSSRVVVGGPQQIKHPGYEGTTNMFQDFQLFSDWVTQEPNYRTKETNWKYWQLDKDIITPFNKVYSPDTCCFVPNELNGLLTWRTRDRGKLPLGVSEDKGRGDCDIVYRAFCNIDGNRTALGRRKTPQEAHKLWQQAKIDEITKKSAKYDFPSKVVVGLQNHADLIYDDLINDRETVR